jgi:hypothetical protein
MADRLSVQQFFEALRAQKPPLTSSLGTRQGLPRMRQANL